MAEALAKANFNVHVIEWDRDSRLTPCESIGEISVHRFRLRAVHGFSLIYLLPLWWLYVAKFSITHCFDVIQPQNLDNLLPVWLVSRVRRFMIVYDIADFYADAYVPVRYSFLRKIVRLFEVFLIKTVTATILVDEARIKQIGFKPARFCIIYNSPPDIYEKFSLAKNSAEKKGRLDIFYAGGISESQGVYTLVDGCQEVSGLSLKVAGFGKDIEHFSNYIKNKKGVEFLGRISYWKVLELTMQSDCVAVLYDPRIPNMIYSSPNKLFEAMMCGKAIIVSAGTAMAKKVLNENCGLVVTCGSVAGLQEALSQLKDDPSLSMELGQNGRKAYLKKYNWCLMEKRLVLLYTSLILEKEN